MTPAEDKGGPGGGPCLSMSTAHVNFPPTGHKDSGGRSAASNVAQVGTSSSRGFISLISSDEDDSERDTGAGTRPQATGGRKRLDARCPTRLREQQQTMHHKNKVTSPMQFALGALLAHAPMKLTDAGSGSGISAHSQADWNALSVASIAPPTRGARPLSLEIAAQGEISSAPRVYRSGL